MRKRAGSTHDRDSSQPQKEAQTMNTAGRRIGRAGTISRVIVALGLLYLALTHSGALIGFKRPGSATYHLTFTSRGLSWGLTWYDAVLGLVVFPALILGRDDQIGCPAFTPIDALEARHRPGQRPAAAWASGPPTTPRQTEPERP